jgi:hypothetical protein
MHARPTAAPRRRPSVHGTSPAGIAARSLGMVLLLTALVAPIPALAAAGAGDGRAALADAHAIADQPGSGSSTPQLGPGAGHGHGVFEGRLERLVEETVAQGRSIERFYLVTSAGSLELHFAGGAPAGFDNGARVRVHGFRNGGVVQVDEPGTAAEGGSSAQVLTAAPGSGTGARRIAVVPINFINDRRRPFTRTQAGGIVLTNTRSARTYFAEESKGLVRITGVAFDWVQLSASSATCDPQGWATEARSILASRGVDVASFTNIVFAFPHTNSCPWAGLGHLPGWHTWINGTPSLRTVVHELGHNFGAHHASAIHCTSSGHRVALSPKCSVDEYGDPFSTMGTADRRLHHAMHLAQLGYLDASAARTITGSGTYILMRETASSGVRVLRVARGDGTYLYFDYRRPYGTLYDDFSRKAPVVKGVSVRIGGDWGQIIQTKLVDMHPSTWTFTDAPLAVSQSFRDYQSGVTLKVTARSKYRIWVRVTLPSDRTAPTTPGSFVATPTSPTEIALSWFPSTDDRSLAGYRIYRDGVLAATAGASATSFTDTGLAPDTSHWYAIHAVDAAGNLSPAATALATTLPLDDPPSAPVASIAHLNGQWSVVSWTAATDDNGITGYLVLRDGLLSQQLAADARDAHVPNDAAAYVVIAVDTAGQQGAPSNEVRL